MVVGHRIDSLLAEKGWSQAELARRVGVSQQTIWKLIAGHSQGSKHIYAISRALGTTPEFLDGETDDPSKPTVPVWQIIPERLQSAMERAGLNQSQLADAVDLKQPSIGRLLSGETKTSRALDRIARALETTSAYLIGEVDDPSLLVGGDVRQKFLDTAADDNLVPVQEIDLKFGMGETVLDIPVTTEVRRFDRSWLRQFTNAAPSELFFAQGIGDSMMPTLLNSDILLIDTSQKTVQMADHIWAVAMHGGGMIKRLRPWKEGVQIISDNPNVPDAMAYDGELFVIGRVVAVVRKI